MPAEVATLAVGLVLKTGPFFAALGGTLNKSSSMLATWGTKASLMVTVPIMGIIAAAAKMGMEYETAFAEVLKAVEEATDEFGNLTDRGEQLERMFRDMAMELPLSRNELARIGAIAGQLGIKGAEDIRKFTETIAKISVATDLSIERASFAFARFMNVMGMNIDELDELASTVVFVGTKVGATESEIMNLALRMSGTAAIIGMSEHAVIGMAGAMRELEIRAEMGGTAMSKILTTMFKAVKEGEESLQTFANVAGLTIEEFTTLFAEKPEMAVLAFVQGLQEIADQGGNVFDVLEQLELGERRVLEVLLKMAAGNEQVAEALAFAAKGWDENIALEREFAIFANTTRSQLIMLWSTITDVAISIFGAFNPAIKEGIARLKAFAIAISELARESPELLKTIVLIALAIAGIGPALVIVATTVSILSWAIGAILSPLGLLIAGFVALAAAAYKFVVARYEIESFADAVIVFSGFIARALDWIAEKLGGLVDFIADAAEWGASAMESFAQGIIGAAGLVIRAIGYIAGVITGLLGPGSPPAVLPELADWGRQAINEFLHGMMQADFDILEDVGNIIARHLRGIAFEDEDALTDALARAQVALAQVVFEARTAGQASAEAWQNLRGAIQDSTGEIERYIHLRFALAQAEQKLASAEEHRSQVMSQLDDERFEMRQRHSEALRVAEERVDRAEANRKSALAALDEERFQMELRHKTKLREVDEKVKAAEEALRTFREQSAEIPARFTRGRERQLQAELRAVQEEREAMQERHEIEQEQFDIRKRRIQETVDAQVEAARQQQESVRESQKIETQQFEIRRHQIEQQLDAQVEAAQKHVDLIQAQTRWLENLMSLRQKFVDLFGKEKEGLSELGELWKRTLDDIMPGIEGLKDRVGEITDKAKELFGIWKAFWAGLTGVALDEELKNMTDEERAMYQAGLDVNEAWEKFTGVLGTVVEALAPIGEAIQKVLDPEAMEELMGELGKAMAAGFIVGLEDIKVWIEESWPDILNIIMTVWDVIASTIGATVDTIVGTIWPHLKGAIDELTLMMDALGITWADVWEAIKQAVGIVALIIGAAIIGLIAIIVGLVNALATAQETIAYYFRRLWEGIMTAVEGIGKALVGWYLVFEGIFTGDIPKVVEGLKLVFQGWLDFLVGIFDYLIGAVTFLFAIILSLVAGFVEGVTDFFQNLYDRLIGASLIPDLINGIVWWFSQLPKRLLAAVEQGLVNLYNRFVRLKNDIIRVLTDLATEGIWKVLDFVNPLVAALQWGYDEIVGESIIPDMVRDINASLAGLDPMLGGLMGLTPAPVAVPAVAGGFAGQLIIQNYWDASLGAKDRAELAAMMERTVYGALGETYGG